MQVLQIYMHNNLRNFNYIIYSEKSKEAIFVDPLDIDRTLDIAKKKQLIPKYLINTHHHFDHIKDNEKFIQQTQGEHLKLTDQQEFRLSSSESILAMDTPGHVSDHQCFLLKENSKPKALISGDALFNAGAGNCKNGGNVHEHFQTVYNRLRSIDDDVVLYPSHDYLLTNLKFAHTLEPENEKINNLIQKRSKQNLDQEFITTTIGEEKEINPFFRLHKGEIENKFSGLSLEERFIKIRKLRDQW